MQVLTKDEFIGQWEVLRRRIRQESLVFVYPTDTIYGIGCNAQDARAVDRIRTIKQRFDNPFSVIAPSKDWIRHNCETGKKAEGWLAKLPGPYTIIFPTVKHCVSSNVNLGTSLGVRIPDHWFTKYVSEIGLPLVTTSVNKTGEDYMTNLEDMDDDIKKKVDFIIYEGELLGKPSTIVNLISDEVKRR
jgi:L-threonylcarbamoyladenylate synthase